jgi:general secretion pathway protein D
MVRINKVRFAGWIVLLLAVLWLGGCTTSMQARSVFEEAEQLSAEEDYDGAIEKYLEASELEPSSKTYRLKMASAKTRAAATHIRRARALKEEGKLSEALEEYRIAEGFDRSVEVAAQEANELLQLLEAEKLAEEGASFWGAGKLLPARKAIAGALKLDSQNARALAIKDLIDQEQKKISMDGIELDVASEESITLSFKDADIKEVFGILSQLSGINFIFDEEIRDQSISVLLEKASFLQAMELILQMNGLDKKVLNGKTIIIYPQSREKDKQYGDQIIQTFYLSHIDAKKAVNLLRTMLQLRKIYVHEERNAIVVRDKPQVIKLAEQILEAADRANSEVLFALEIVSVADTDQLDFGPELSVYGVGVGFSNPGSTNILDDSLSAGGSNENLASSLSNLQTFYTVPTASFAFKKSLASSELLASPKIRVRNREKAKVHIGTREPVITSTTTDTSTTANVQYVDVGVKVDIEPVIQLDNSVETKVKLEVSRVIARDTVANTSALTIQTTNAETVLTIQDGVQTILGGLFEQETTEGKTTIPWIGEIPFLGDLFSSTSDKDTKREILLSITPYIIKQVEVPDIDVATIWSGGEDNLKNGPNFGSFSEPLLSDIDATKPRTSPAAKPPKLIKNAVGEAVPLNETLAPTPPIVPTGQETPPVEAVPLNETPAPTPPIVPSVQVTPPVPCFH